MKKLKVLELFAGTRSIGKAFEQNGHEVFSVEWDRNFENIDLYADISKLTATQILEQFGQPDVIWASPDCSTYSIAAISHHRIKTENTLLPKTDYAKFCDITNRHVLNLIAELEPKYWFIENPRGGLRKMDFMQGLPRYTVTYCQYNEQLVQELIFNMKQKKCPKCGQIKDISEFYKNNSRKDGFSSWCKECDNKNHKEYVAKNRECLREYERMTYYKNHEQHLECRRKSNVKNKEKIKVARKIYYENNKEEILRKDKIYKDRNKELVLEKMKLYYENNKEIFKHKARERKENVKNSSDGTITMEKLNEMYELQQHKCSYCGCDLDVSGKHLDHILPLSRGGLHTLNNVHWVCPKCNLSKNNKTEEEWLKKERCKPTDIFTNHSSPRFKPMCKNGDPCHIPAPRGSKTGTQGLKGSKERSVIPKLLCEHIVEICEQE